MRGRGLVLVDSLPLDIARRRSGAQVDLRDVPLCEADESWLEASRRAGEQKQETRCERIECPRMAGSRLRPPPGGRDDRERRRPGRLVDEDDPARMKRAGRHYRSAAAPTCAVTSSTMNAVISSTESSL